MVHPEALAGGGCTYDIGVHALDRCLYLMGEFDAATVTGKTFAKFGPRGLGNGNWGRSEIDPGAKFDVDDLSIALIKLRSGRDRPAGGVLGRARPPGGRQRDEAVRDRGRLGLPPLQLFRQTQHGYSAETVDLLRPR